MLFFPDRDSIAYEFINNLAAIYLSRFIRGTDNMI